MKRILPISFAIALAFSGQALSQTPSPDGATAYFVNIKNGDTVKSPIKVNFGLSGMGVAPAGTDKKDTGHHHLFVNRAPFGEGDLGEAEFGLPIPSDDNHIHFGKGQTETTLDLPAGEHTLQIVVGDKSHVPHDKPVTSEVITITVE